jgi:hypothetical protein
MSYKRCKVIIPDEKSISLWKKPRLFHTAVTLLMHLHYVENRFSRFPDFAGSPAWAGTADDFALEREKLTLLGALRAVWNGEVTGEDHMQRDRADNC